VSHGPEPFVQQDDVWAFCPGGRDADPFKHGLSRAMKRGVECAYV